MKLNLKKVLPIAAVGLMAGITFAHAATLSDWPAPFVQAGQADVTIVYGADANAMDVASASDFTAALQAALGGVGQTQETSVSGESVKLERSGNKYNLNESMTDVYTADLDSTAFPTILAGGTYEDTKGANKNTVDYTEKIKLGASGVLGLYQDDTLAPQSGNYLYFQQGTGAYTYVLEFASPVVYDNSTTSDASNDLVTTKLNILGKKYTITGVKLSGGKLDEIELQAGDANVWLSTGESKQWQTDSNTYNVTVIGVGQESGGDYACGVEVNGESQWLTEGETSTIGGLDVGVLTVIQTSSNGEGQCELTLGSTKITIKDGQEIKVSDNRVDGTTVYIDDTGGAWSGFNFTYEPTDDVYLSAGEELQDPAFGAFKIIFGGTHADYEEIKVSTSVDHGTVEFLNNEGKPITLEFYNVTDGSNTYFAWSRDNDGDPRDLILVGGNETINCGSSITRCENMEFLVTSGSDTRLYRIANIDPNNDEITIDEVGGAQGNAQHYNNGSTTTLSLPGGLSVDMVIDESGPTVMVDLSGNGPATTYGGASIDFASYLAVENVAGNIEQRGAKINVSAGVFKFTEDDEYDGDDPYAFPADVLVNMSWDPADSEIDLEIPGIDSNKYFGPVDASDTDSDTQYYETYYGTKVEWDNKNRHDLVIYHPDQELYADVFVAESTASVSGGTVGGTPGATLGSVVFSDTEVQNTPELQAKNLIVVGGSAVNRVAAELLGLGYPTYGSNETWQNSTGVDSEGKAILKLFENPYASDKVALLVAGWSAQDTRRATQALINKVEGLEGKSEALLDTSQATAVVIS